MLRAPLIPTSLATTTVAPANLAATTLTAAALTATAQPAFAEPARGLDPHALTSVYSQTCHKKEIRPIAARFTP